MKGDFSPYFHGSYNTFSEYTKPTSVKQANTVSTNELYTQNTTKPFKIDEKTEQPVVFRQPTGNTDEDNTKKLFKQAKKFKSIYDQWKQPNYNTPANMTEAEAVAAEEGWGTTATEVGTEAVVEGEAFTEGLVGAETLEGASIATDVSTATEGAIAAEAGAEAGTASTGASTAGAEAGASSGGMSAAGTASLVAAIIALATEIQMNDTTYNQDRFTNPETGELQIRDKEFYESNPNGIPEEDRGEYFRTQNLFSGSGMTDQTAVRFLAKDDEPTMMEINDAYAQKGDAAGYFKTWPAAAQYWGNPAQNWITMAGDKFFNIPDPIKKMTNLLALS